MLWKQTGTGLTWALVRFGGSATAEPQTRWFWVTNVAETQLSGLPAQYNVGWGWQPIDGTTAVAILIPPSLHRSHFRVEQIIAATLIPTENNNGQPLWLAHYSQPSAFQEYVP